MCILIVFGVRLLLVLLAVARRASHSRTACNAETCSWWCVVVRSVTVYIDTDIGIEIDIALDKDIGVLRYKFRYTVDVYIYVESDIDIGY